LASYLDIPDEYEIIFMAGGGNGQFSATVYNLVGAWVTKKQVEVLKQLGATTEADADEGKLVAELRKIMDSELNLDYLLTGDWSLKAYQEAGSLARPEHTNLAVDARMINDGEFGRLPEEGTWKLSKDAAFVYACDNETVDAVEFPKFRDVLVLKVDGTGPIVVADISLKILLEDFRSRNFRLYSLERRKTWAQPVSRWSLSKRVC
jgi:phosphoserine aminotransferase